MEYYYYLDTGSFHDRPTFAKIKETNKISKDIADIIKSERIYSKIITKFMLLCNELTDIEYLDKFIDTYINIVDIEKPIKQHKGVIYILIELRWHVKHIFCIKIVI